MPKQFDLNNPEKIKEFYRVLKASGKLVIDRKDLIPMRKSEDWQKMKVLSFLDAYIRLFKLSKNHQLCLKMSFGFKILECVSPHFFHEPHENSPNYDRTFLLKSSGTHTNTENHLT